MRWFHRTLIALVAVVMFVASPASAQSRPRPRPPMYAPCNYFLRSSAFGFITTAWAGYAENVLGYWIGLFMIANNTYEYASCREWERVYGADVIDPSGGADMEVDP